MVFFIYLFGLFGQQIRKEMIDNKTGNYTISTLVKCTDKVILFDDAYNAHNYICLEI